MKTPSPPVESMLERVRARIEQADEAPTLSVLAQIAITADMRPGVVSLPHGWGHDLAGSQLTVAARHPGVNMNLLLDDEARDPLSGTSVLSGIPVRLSAAEA